MYPKLINLITFGIQTERNLHWVSGSMLLPHSNYYSMEQNFSGTQ